MDKYLEALGVTLKWWSDGRDTTLGLSIYYTGAILKPSLEYLFDYEIKEGLRKSPKIYSQWLLSRLAAKFATSRLLQLDPSLVAVLKQKCGRPCLLYDGKALNTSVSMSHTIGASVAIIGKNNISVGVDVESINRVLKEKFLNYVFNASEHALAKNDYYDLNYSFLAMWCAKEAALKSCGLGLLGYISSTRIIWVDWEKKIIKVFCDRGNINHEIMVSLCRQGNYLIASAI